MEKATQPASIIRSGKAIAEQVFPANDANKLLETDGKGISDLADGMNRHIR
jgi:3-oxoacyl-[acyl-carrier-protein] synthase III